MLLLLPWSREGLLRGLSMVGARGWYRTIMEFRPLLPSGLSSVSDDLWRVLGLHGLTPLAVLCGVALGWRRFRRGAVAERGPALLFGVAAGALLVLGWMRNRFGVYLSIMEALSAALVAREAAAAAAVRWPARAFAGPAAGVAVAALLMGPVLPRLYGSGWVPVRELRADLAPVARMAGYLPVRPGREAVLAPWTHGHDVRYWSGRPVVSSPFGVEGGPGALEVDAAFHAADDQAAAEELLAGRRVGLVLISAPLDEWLSLEDLAPPGSLRVLQHRSRAGRVDEVNVLPAFRQLVAVRLWLWDGMWGELDGRLLGDGPPALDGFRLVGESQAMAGWRAVGHPVFKLFEPVAGARLEVRGASPGGRVEASTELRTTAGRLVTWRTSAAAGADGLARLRLPYAAGFNGAVLASPWRVTAGRLTAEVSLDEPAVLHGEPRAVTLLP